MATCTRSLPSDLRFIDAVLRLNSSGALCKLALFSPLRPNQFPTTFQQ